jgi:hypothetical protein
MSAILLAANWFSDHPITRSPDPTICIPYPTHFNPKLKRLSVFNPGVILGLNDVARAIRSLGPV